MTDQPTKYISKEKLYQKFQSCVLISSRDNSNYRVASLLKNFHKIEIYFTMTMAIRGTRIITTVQLNRQIWHVTRLPFNLCKFVSLGVAYATFLPSNFYKARLYFNFYIHLFLQTVTIFCIECFEEIPKKPILFFT